LLGKENQGIKNFRGFNSWVKGRNQGQKGGGGKKVTRKNTKKSNKKPENDGISKREKVKCPRLRDGKNGKSKKSKSDSTNN